MNRRSFAKWLPVAAALPALASGLPLASAASLAGSAANPTASASPLSPLTPAQMARYQKNAPQRARSQSHLRAFDLANGDQPDFVFFAAPEARR